METVALLPVTDTVITLYFIYKANDSRKRGKGFKGQMNPVHGDLGALNWFMIFL